MADLTEEFVMAYHVTQRGFYVWPLFGEMCQCRNDAVKEAKRMIRNGETGVRLVSIKIRGDKKTGLMHKESPVDEKF